MVPPVASAVVEFVSLDPAVVGLWRLTSLIASGFILLPSLAFVLFVGFAARPLMGWLLAAWFGLAAVRLCMLVWYPKKAFAAWGYRIDEKVLEARSGVWFKVTQLLPLSRLQHVDLHRGPLERYFGLASLVLHTAGTQQAAIVIPGLKAEAAERLRDQLVAAGGDDAV
ncbi:MAG: PH domain-containing protein [Verrucomicrobiota bacterium]